MAENQSNQSKQYTEKDLEDLFKQASGRGAVLANLYFDAYGKTKEVVVSSLVEFVDRISKEKGVLYCKGQVAEAVEKGDDRFSSYSDVRVLADSLSTLFNLCLRYGPVAVEIEQPTKFNLDVQAMQALLLDASQTMQDYSNYILKKVLKPQDIKILEDKIASRVEVGKKLLSQNTEPVKS